MRKKLPYLCCILLTVAVISCSLFLPQAGFAFIDNGERQKKYTEAANEASGKAVSESDKLFALAELTTGHDRISVRFSNLFFQTGKEISKNELLDTIKNEMSILDPADSLLFLSGAKENNVFIKDAQLHTILFVDSKTNSFPIWQVSVTAGAYLYTFYLDAVSGKIYTVSRDYIFNPDSEQSYEFSPLEPPVYDNTTTTDLIFSFADYLGYPAAYIDKYTEDAYTVSLDQEEFCLSLSVMDTGVTLHPSFL